jgi:hypothetical protein
MAAEAQANGAVTDDRVEALREQMKQAGVDAYIVPSEDAHMVHLLHRSVLAKDCGGFPPLLDS